MASHTFHITVEYTKCLILLTTDGSMCLLKTGYFLKLRTAILKIRHLRNCEIREINSGRGK